MEGMFQYYKGKQEAILKRMKTLEEELDASKGALSASKHCVSPL